MVAAVPRVSQRFAITHPSGRTQSLISLLFTRASHHALTDVLCGRRRSTSGAGRRTFGGALYAFDPRVVLRCRNNVLRQCVEVLAVDQTWLKSSKSFAQVFPAPTPWTSSAAQSSRSPNLLDYSAPAPSPLLFSWVDALFLLALSLLLAPLRGPMAQFPGVVAYLRKVIRSCRSPGISRLTFVGALP